MPGRAGHLNRKIYQLSSKALPVPGQTLMHTTCIEFTCKQKSKLNKGGSVAEWFRALDLKSGGPWFKSSTLLLSGFVLISPEFNSSKALCK